MNNEDSPLGQFLDKERLALDVLNAIGARIRLIDKVLQKLCSVKADSSDLAVAVGDLDRVIEKLQRCTGEPGTPPGSPRRDIGGGGLPAQFSELGRRNWAQQTYRRRRRAFEAMGVSLESFADTIVRASVEQFAEEKRTWETITS